LPLGALPVKEVEYRAMKVPLPNDMPLDLTAPTLAAYARNRNGHKRLLVWCKFCGVWHSHGQGEGHREAHCQEETPYSRTGKQRRQHLR
jgi:hypothetical protein